MLVVLPAQGKTVAEIEEEIANATESPEAKLRYRLGSVDLPWFGFAENRDLTPTLEEMGLRRAFGTPEAFSAMKKGRMGLALTDFSQASQIQVDPEGIRVDAVVGAEGMVGGILGGTLGPPPTHFHMVVNRPFLFFVRDNMTGSLVFEGAVMDPSPAN
ncbi:MAG: serpin family protein [Candidatus Acidiferrales bacterium]